MVQEEVVVAEKECVAVRLLAEYPDLDYYIYLMFFIDKDNLKLIGMEMLVSNNYDFFNLLNNTNDLKELYKHIEFAVSTENNLIFPSDKLKEDINKILKDRVNRFNIVNYLIKNDIVYKYYSVNDIKSFIENTKDDIQNKKIDFDVYNFFSNAEYEMINEEEDIADKYQIINASLVVSPVNGTPINEIKIGDMVVVSINSNLYEENMIYIESKGKKDEYSKALVPGEIIEKVVTDENVKLTIKLSDEYCAVIEETEPIKLRIFDPDKDTYIAPVVSMDERLNLIAKFFDNLSIFQLIMYGLGITSLFVLLYILYTVIFNT